MEKSIKKYFPVFALPTLAEKATAPASDWTAVKENSTVVSVEETADGTKLNFKSSTWGDDYMAATTKAYKLDGLYIRATQLALPETHCINLLFGTTSGSLSSRGLLFLMNNFGSDIYGIDEAGAQVRIPYGAAPVRNSNRQGFSIYFVRNDDGSFTVCRVGTDPKRFTLSKEEVKTYFGSEDPSVYLTISDNWWSNGAGKNNSLVISELSTGNTNGFADYCDPWDRDLYVTQEDALTNIVINHKSNHGAVSNLMKKVPLDGLTLQDVEISFQAMFRFGINLNALADNGYTCDLENGGDAGFLVRVDKENGKVFCTYTTGGGADDVVIGSLGNDFTKFTLQIV